MLSVPLMPIKIVLPFLITRYVLGPSPMNIFIKSVPYKLAAGILIAAAIFIGPFVIEKDYIPSSYYVAVFAILAIQEMISYCMFVSAMAFYAKISDASCGGTYMTLLNTATNLGSSWPSTVALALVEWFTFSSCDSPIVPQCSGCEQQSHCHVIFDGYFGEVIFCTIFGIVWVIWASKVMKRLQNVEESEWRVKAS